MMITVLTILCLIKRAVGWIFFNIFVFHILLMKLYSMQVHHQHNANISPVRLRHVGCLKAILYRGTRLRNPVSMKEGTCWYFTIPLYTPQFRRNWRRGVPICGGSVCTRIPTMPGDGWTVSSPNPAPCRQSIRRWFYYKSWQNKNEWNRHENTSLWLHAENIATVPLHVGNFLTASYWLMSHPQADDECAAYQRVSGGTDSNLFGWVSADCSQQANYICQIRKQKNMVCSRTCRGLLAGFSGE